MKELTLWAWASSQAEPQTDWIGGHTFFTLVLNTRGLQGLCAQPPPAHSVQTWLQSQTWGEHLGINSPAGSRAEKPSASQLQQIQLIVDFGKREANARSLVYISGAEVERVNKA